MTQTSTHLYEGLFLVSQSSAAGDYAGVVNHLKEIFTRAEADVETLSKWDERRLAYDINGTRRGVYFLAVFNARGSQIANIERDCNLSETIMRQFILRADHMGDVELELAKQAIPADTDPAMQTASTEEKATAPVTEAPVEAEVKAEEAPVAAEAASDAEATTAE